jgi:hypothetical protein
MGGFGFGGVEPVDEKEDAEERRLLRSCATEGTAGAEAGGRGGAPPGTLGATVGGGLGGVVLDSPGSERYGACESAPVSTPPTFRSLGIPPASSPAN